MRYLWVSSGIFTGNKHSKNNLLFYICDAMNNFQFLFVVLRNKQNKMMKISKILTQLNKYWFKWGISNWNELLFGRRSFYRQFDMTTHLLKTESFTKKRDKKQFVSATQTTWMHNYQWKQQTLTYTSYMYGRYEQRKLPEITQNTITFYGRKYFIDFGITLIANHPMLSCSGLKCSLSLLSCGLCTMIIPILQLKCECTG